MVKEEEKKAKSPKEKYHLQYRHFTTFAVMQIAESHNIVCVKIHWTQQRIHSNSKRFGSRFKQRRRVNTKQATATKRTRRNTLNVPVPYTLKYILNTLRLGTVQIVTITSNNIINESLGPAVLLCMYPPLGIVFH